MTGSPFNKILVVEDDFSYQSIYKKIFTHINQDSEIRVANSLHEALLEMTHSRDEGDTPFNVFIVDYFLPDGKGVDLFEHMKKAGFEGIFILTSAKENALASKEMKSISPSVIDSYFVPKNTSYREYFREICRALVRSLQ